MRHVQATLGADMLRKWTLHISWLQTRESALRGIF
jgi:hypothetical protein